MKEDIIIKEHSRLIKHHLIEGLKSISKRHGQLINWALSELKLNLDNSEDISLSVVGSDAGSRQYFRLNYLNQSILLVDAPIETENTLDFIKIGQVLKSINLKVPEVIAYNLDQGFLLVEDLGDRLFIGELTEKNSQDLYIKALSLLNKIQTANTDGLPDYDASFLTKELAIFKEWFLQQFLHIAITDHTNNLLEDVNNLLVHNAMKQPKTFIHRDFHSRNLINLDSGDIAIIDFQGAVKGPILYDVVSLLKDCYIEWPESKVYEWLVSYMKTHKILNQFDHLTCLKWFDWIGLQRHLKCLGIFSRLSLQDNKLHYMKAVPRTLNYVLTVTKKYQELELFHQWLVANVVNKVDQIY